MRFLTYTALYPNAQQPNFGIFIHERLRRLSARVGQEHTVIAPVPWFPRLPGFGRWTQLARVPACDHRDGITVLHPRYLKIPKLGLERQASAMVRGTRILFDTICDRLGIDVIDSHYLYPDAVAAGRLAARRGLPWIATARGSDVNVLLEIEPVRRQVAESLAQAHAVLGVSRALLEKIAELANVPRQKLVRVPNGVDLGRFSPGDRVEACRRAGLDPARRHVVFVGRLVRAKGVHELLLAFDRAPEDVDLVFVGAGPERSSLEAEAARLGLGARVIFTGERRHHELPDSYRSADLFALPSYNEGHPNVVCEALACGVPVLASDAGGIPEVVDDAVGCLVPRGEPGGDPLVEALRDALPKALERRFDPRALAAKRRTLGWDETLSKLERVLHAAARGEPWTMEPVGVSNS